MSVSALRNVAVVGCGAVLPYYFPATLVWPHLEVVAWADLEADRAQAAAERFAVGAPVSPEKAIASPDVDIVLNLTPSLLHAEVSSAALAEGKSVYTEKPIAAGFGDAAAVVALAARQGIRLGTAPDTFMGTTPQTARVLIDQGLIGIPRVAVAAFTGGGVPARLDDPLFPGTLLDVGVYYVSHLVALLGPVQSVAGMVDNFLADLDGGPHFERTLVNTHFSALFRFASGAIGVMLVGFGLGAGSLPHVEVHGTEGTLILPNPNRFDGELLYLPIGEAPRRVASRAGPAAAGWNSRGIGLADMALAASSGRAHRASAEFGLHVCEVMSAVETASRTGTAVPLATTCERPTPMPVDGFEEELAR